MTTIQLLSDTHALLIDQDIKTDIYFDPSTKKGLNEAKNGALYIRLPKNSTGRSSVSLNVLENGEPYELTERHNYSANPKYLDGTSDADRQTRKSTSAQNLQQYVTTLSTYLDEDEQQTFINLLTKAIARKSAKDTLEELKALYAKKQQEADQTAAKIAELEAQR